MQAIGTDNRFFAKGAGFLFLLLIFLRISTLFIPILDADEAIYGLFARIWFDGGIPYVSCVETKPLGIYTFYGVIFSIFGRFNMFAVHMVTTLVVGLTAYVIFKTTDLIYNNRKAAYWSALFYIVFSTTYIPKYIATTIEPIMLLPVCLQFYFWLKFERENKKSYALFSGVMFSLSCLFKYQAGMNFIIMMLYLGGVRPFLNREIKYFENWRGFGKFILGAIPLPIIMLLYLKNVGALEGFWLWNIKGNADYVSEGLVSINLFKQILTRVLPYIASTVLLWVLAVKGSFNVLRETRDARRETRNGLLILLWFLLTIIPVSAGFRFYGHYFILLLPPMSILASAVADKTWSVEGKKWAKCLVVLGIIIPSIGFFVARIYISEIHKAVGEDTLKEYKPIARYIEENTEPSDKIISWGYAPLVYWYSERLPATRFFWSDLLTGRVPGTKGEGSDAFIMPEAWEMFMEDISRNKPIYIVDTAPSKLHNYEAFPVTRYPRLMEYINKNYHEEVRINGTVFYRRNGERHGK